MCSERASARRCLGGRTEAFPGRRPQRQCSNHRSRCSPLFRPPVSFSGFRKRPMSAPSPRGGGEGPGGGGGSSALVQQQQGRKIQRLAMRHAAMQASHSQMELEWLRDDVNLLSQSLDRRHAFLTSVRDQQRADTEMVALLESRADRMREQLARQRERQADAIEEVGRRVPFTFSVSAAAGANPRAATRCLAMLGEGWWVRADRWSTGLSRTAAALHSSQQWHQSGIRSPFSISLYWSSLKSSFATSVN